MGFDTYTNTAPQCVSDDPAGAVCTSVINSLNVHSQYPHGTCISVMTLLLGCQSLPQQQPEAG
jgi:hypothetical protein